MEPTLMPGAFFDGVSLGASLAILYITIGVLIAMARWKAWETEGNTLAKILIAPLASTSTDRARPFTQNKATYHALVALSWPTVATWNIVTLTFGLCTLLIAFGLERGTFLMKTTVQTVVWHLKYAARVASRYLRASPETRTRRRIQRLETRRYQLRSYIARERARVALIEERITNLSDSLPTAETGSGPYRSARLRVVS